MRKLLVLSMSLALGLTALMAAPVAAKDFKCDFDPPPEDEWPIIPDIVGGTYDNVIVPAGAFCALEDAKIKGNFIVRKNAGGVLFGSVVKGNVECDGCDWVAVFDGSKVFGDMKADGYGALDVDGSMVKGNVQAKDGTEEFVPPILFDCTIHGDVQFENGKTTNPEFGFGALVEGCTIRGNVQMKDNKSVGQIFGTGAVLVGSNVRGDVQLDDNRAAGEFGAGAYVGISEEFGRSNEIRGDLQLEGNRSTGADAVGIGVESNRIRGNCQAKDNSEPVFVTGNEVKGDTEGQCKPTEVEVLPKTKQQAKSFADLLERARDSRRK